MAAPARDELPIPDYDHLPVTGLGHRIRSLTEAEIDVLIAYETAHGNRLPVVNVLQQRRRALAEGAAPSGGDPTGLAPEVQGTPTAVDDASAGRVSPATQGPVQNPPAHGVPTNPAQPRSTG